MVEIEEDRYSTKIYLKATIGKLVIGGMTLKGSRGVYRIEGIQVNQKFRRKGIGSKLIRGAQKRAEKITLTCEAGLVGWYEKQGFRRIRKDNNLIFMEWKK